MDTYTNIRTLLRQDIQNSDLNNVNCKINTINQYPPGPKNIILNFIDNNTTPLDYAGQCLSHKTKTLQERKAKQITPTSEEINLINNADNIITTLQDNGAVRFSDIQALVTQEDRALRRGLRESIAEYNSMRFNNLLNYLPIERLRKLWILQSDGTLLPFIENAFKLLSDSTNPNQLDTETPKRKFQLQEIKKSLDSILRNFN